jgi:hypothetical protein
MKRVIITNLQGQHFSAVMEDPTDWISFNVSNNSWGTPERTKWKDECTDDELSLVMSENEVELSPAIPGDPSAEPPTEDIPAVTRILATLKATYSITVDDIQSEIDAETTRRAQIRAFKQRLKTLAGQSDLTAAEVKEAILKFIKLQLLVAALDE